MCWKSIRTASTVSRFQPTSESTTFLLILLTLPLFSTPALSIHFSEFLDEIKEKAFRFVQVPRSDS